MAVLVVPRSAAVIAQEALRAMAAGQASLRKDSGFVISATLDSWSCAEARSLEGRIAKLIGFATPHGAEMLK